MNRSTKQLLMFLAFTLLWRRTHPVAMVALLSWRSSPERAPAKEEERDGGAIPHPAEVAV